MITETGYSLGDKRFNDFPAIDDELRATYMLRAFRDGFLQWPELPDGGDALSIQPRLRLEAF